MEEPPKALSVWWRFVVVATVVAIQAAGYLTLNKVPLKDTVEVPETWLDARLPFLVWTIWPYLAILFVSPVLPVMIRDREIFRQTFVGYLVAIAIMFAIFIAMPTYCPRPPVPTNDSLSGRVYNGLMEVDRPVCAFPSGHMIIPMMTCWGLWRDKHPWRWWLVPLVMGLTPSILTTKQHYVGDLVGAAVVSMIGMVVGEWSRSWPEAQEPQDETCD